MGLAHSPSIITNGLLICLDAANTKSYDTKENLVIFSEDFSNATWAKSNISVSTDQITSPFGNLTADALIENTQLSAYHYINSSSISKPSASITYTFSCYAKAKGTRRLGLRVENAGSGSVAGFDLNTGVVARTPGSYGTGFSGATANITASLNGWYRVSLTFTSDTANSIIVQFYLITNDVNNTAIYDGDGTSGVYVWGAQLEEGSSASNYSATTSTQKIRSSAWNNLIGTNSGILNNMRSNVDSNNLGSLKFDGVDEYISFSSNPTFTNQMSAEFWVKLEDPQGPNSTGQLFGREGNYRLLYANTSFSWICATVNNGWYTTGTYISIGSVSPFTQIYHVVATYGGENLKLYVNGTLRTTGSAISGNILQSSSWPNSLMRSDAANIDYGQGNLYVHRLYNRELSLLEIQQNFNAQRGRFGI